MKHTKEWKSYLDSLKERAENTEPKYAQDAKDAEETLDMIFDCEKAADSGDEYALFFLATYKVERGIDFAENVAFLENLANKDNTNALVALGFLYAVGVFNEFDKSKSALIDTADDANAAKNVEGMVSLFHKCSGKTSSSGRWLTFISSGISFRTAP